MAKRLIDLREMDDLEGLVERHYRLQERLEDLEVEAAAYDLAPSGVTEWSEQLKQVRLEVKQQLDVISKRLEQKV